MDKVKLTRKETVAIWDFLSKMNLRGATSEFARKVIAAQAALHTVAKQVMDEDNVVRSRYLDSEEAKAKCREFSQAYENMMSSRVGGTGSPDNAAVVTFKEAYEGVQPFNDAIEECLQGLEKDFSFCPDIDRFTLSELVTHYSQLGKDFSIQSFNPIIKLIAL